MSTETNSRSFRTGLDTAGWAGVVLASLLGVVYLYLASSTIPAPTGISFLLAGLGYIGAVVLFVRGYWRRRVCLVGIVYNALLIVLYFLFNGVEVSEMLGLDGVVKLAQVVFIVLLVGMLNENW